MNFLYMLEKIRLPGLNEIMLGITNLGDEFAFLAIALIAFWCVNKKLAYYILSVGFIGTISNQFLKLACRVPRPWVLDENFTIVEQARAGASGYSFPSGHTQCAVGTYGALAYCHENKTARILALVAAVLVPFSRMYLGVHTPWDVLAAATMALVLIFVLRPAVYSGKKWTMPALLLIMAGLAFVFLGYVELNPFPADMDQQNLTSGIQNAYTLAGAVLGFAVVYFVDEHVLYFPTQAVWWAQILKGILGLTVVIGVKTVLKAPVEGLLGPLMGRFAQYFLVVLTAGILWPLTFRWFYCLGKNESR